MDEFVELPDTGTVTTFAIINIPFPGQRIKPPYVAAYVLLDGAEHTVPYQAEQPILEAVRAAGKEPPRSLWHPLLFFTVGEIVGAQQSPVGLEIVAHRQRVGMAVEGREPDVDFRRRDDEGTGGTGTETRAGPTACSPTRGTGARTSS